MATIGQQLQKAREARHLTVDQVAANTRIRAIYIKALEEDDFTAMPSPVQGRGFLRLYVQYMGLDMEAMLEEARRTQAELQDAKPSPEPTPPAPAPVSSPDSQAEAVPVPPDEQPAPNGEADASQASQEPSSSTTPAADSPDAPEEAASPPTSIVPSEPIWTQVLAWIRARVEALPIGAGAGREVPNEVEDEAPQPAATVAAQRNSREIFQSIGETLRQRREMLSLTLEEIETHTHVRVHYLQALEAGNLEALPSPVQMRGMLNNYASFLDLEVEAVMLEFADGLQAQYRERHPAQPVRKPARRILPPLRTFIVPDLLFFVGVAAVLLILAIWGTNRIIAMQSARSTPLAQGPSISEALITGQPGIDVTGTPEAALQPQVVLAATPTLPLIEDQGDNGDGGLINLNIIVVERTWLRVTVDGEVAFEGRAIPGAALPFDADQSIEVVTGNAASLRIIYNQRDLGLMGGFGELADRVYSAQGVATATATLPPSPTATSIYSPVPSRTPRSTPTSTLIGSP